MSLKLIRLLTVAACALTMAACSHMAPKYSPSINNVQAIKDAGSPKVRVGEFTEPSDLDSIFMRASIKMVSPINDSYGAYLSDALRQELDLAQALNPDSAVEISGNLTKNDVDTSGFSTGSSTIEAHFIVKNAGTVKYDKVKSATTTFDSSFAAAIAIPNAIQSYPVVVQKLLASLYADPDFITALK